MMTKSSQRPGFKRTWGTWGGCDRLVLPDVRGILVRLFGDVDRRCICSHRDSLSSPRDGDSRCLLSLGYGRNSAGRRRVVWSWAVRCLGGRGGSRGRLGVASGRGKIRRTLHAAFCHASRTRGWTRGSRGHRLNETCGLVRIKLFGKSDRGIRFG